MQNNKNIEILEVIYDKNKTANCYSSRSFNNSAPNLSLQKESVVLIQSTGLTSIFKQLLLDENLRENFLKGCGKITYSQNNTSFLYHNSTPFIIHKKIWRLLKYVKGLEMS